MSSLTFPSGLYTDYYQFTMAQGYLLSGKSDTTACFDYFFRENPFDGGYVIFAGLNDVLEYLEKLRFGDEDINYLKGLGFQKQFLEYLRKFKFAGSVQSVREGEVVFPLEPAVRVEGNMIETQIIETVLLNLLNFESLIATKASRVRLAAGGKRVVDFGLRRAQGLGGFHASRAAVIGGMEATSNVLSAEQYDLATTGTQAHSWIQSFDDELTAFRKFAEIYPDKCILLVDTFNTLRSGIPNAITVAKELESKGHALVGIRLDSGDLAYLSKHARAMLDEAGLHNVKIIASNQLDEYLIRSLLQQGAPIDSFGVGTRMITAYETPALDGVYKLCMAGGKPRLKFSENYTKTTLPGLKSIVRYRERDGLFYADGIMLENEAPIDHIFHPFFPEQRSVVRNYDIEPLQRTVMTNGRISAKLPTVAESARYAQERLDHLSPEHKRFENPHVFKVGISTNLMNLRSQLYEELQRINMNGGAVS